MATYTASDFGVTAANASAQDVAALNNALSYLQTQRGQRHLVF